MQPGPTPQATQDFERELEATLREAGRRIVEHAYQAAEPEPQQLPRRVRLGRRQFRRHRPTPRRVATLFGSITLRRCFYQATELGERGLAPLEQRLGIVAGLATPALADAAARLNAEHTQQQTRAALEERHGVRWSEGSLRKVVATMARNLTPYRQENQVRRLLELLEIAQKSRGKHRPTLSVGRDGVMVPLRPCWEEASTATMSVLDRRGRRLGTVYLGRMPQSGQGTMTEQLLHLLRDVLAQWWGATPRLVYITDAGVHPQDFFRYQLRRMKHPRTGESLAWEWIVDYYHACERITVLAEALFGAGAEACRWAATMRHLLRDQSQGVTRVVQRAQALRRHRGLVSAGKPFQQAINYLKKYTPHMNYAAARGRGLPIGSGVTEAACKTIFGYRFKQSGMRWKRAQGQCVLDLRLILKSGVWEACRQRWLIDQPALEPVIPMPAPQPAAPFHETYARSA